MKFVSKNTNLGVVLKRGVQGHPQLGTETISGLYARFKDGVLNVEDETMQELMLKHPAYKVDYFLVTDGQADPYAASRAPSEPTHILSDMKNGHPERVNKVPANITPEMRASLMEIAKEMAKPMSIELAKQMLPTMVMETMKAMAEQHQQAPQETATEVTSAKRPGRPKKVTE